MPPRTALKRQVNRLPPERRISDIMAAAKQVFVEKGYNDALIREEYGPSLMDHLSDPEDISVVLRKVIDQVLKETDGKQLPTEYGSLTGGALVLSAIKGQ